MVHLNLFLWLAMVGVVFVPSLDNTAKWIAIVGLAVSALWEHSAARGFLKPKKYDVPSAPAAR